MTYRILITGSRTLGPDDLDTIAEALNHAIKEAPSKEIVVVHGDCPRGADHITAVYCEGLDWPERIGKTLSVEPHPADWKRHGRGAGFSRNAEMVNAGADLCLAFVARCVKPRCGRPRPHGSHGATHCADLAERAGIETRRYVCGVSS